MYEFKREQEEMDRLIEQAANYGLKEINEICAITS
jgi:hypothetical protein